ncbi:MAG: alpha/beta fold hydrolase [Pseudomonadota bacterium]
MEVGIHVLGEFAVTVDGQAAKLPSSRKTRALLAYLAITDRPHRRDRLCELLWDVADDPRAALRWSLSKLRPIVNHDDAVRLITDRERVQLDVSQLSVDLNQIDAELDADTLSLDTLLALAQRLEEPLLPGLDFAEQEPYARWIQFERAQHAKRAASVAQRIREHDALPVSEACAWSARWLALDPYNAEAARRCIEDQQRFGDSAEATRLTLELSERFKNAGLPLERRANERADASAVDAVADSNALLAKQRIQFCVASDDVRIAYASVGEGPAVVKAANWLSHLELDWDAPIWSPLFRRLARRHQFIRYDERGNGLSDWKVPQISSAAFLSDLESVVDAVGVERFALLGISQGASVSIEYAVRYPERVSHLVLFGGYVQGWRINADATTIAEREAIMTLTQTGWGRNDPTYRQIFSSTFMPDANPEELAWFNEFQRQTTSPENAARFLSAFGDIDVQDLLSQVQVPTLVLHSRGDRRIPFDVGRDIAARIPNAQFVGLDSDSHLLLGRERASDEFVRAVEDFLSG